MFMHILLIIRGPDRQRSRLRLCDGGLKPRLVRKSLLRVAGHPVVLDKSSRAV